MSQVVTQELNQERAEAFGARVLGMLNDAALSLMFSIGHRTGLFDVLARIGPATCPRLAEEAGLNERYVREWLGALVTGGVVEYDPDARTYVLPAEHAAWLTRNATPNNLAAGMQWFSILGAVEDRIVECFRGGGGVDYCEFHRFHEAMAEESAQTVVAALLDHIVPLVPGLWQRLERGIEVLDNGCGRGRAMLLLAETFPNSRFAGYDLSEEAIADARAQAQRRGLANIRFEARDMAQLDEVERYDLITSFDAIHDQARPATVLRNLHRALTPDGVFLMQDIAASSHLEKNIEHPLAPFFYTISTMHCMTVSLAQGGDGLGTCWGRELALRMLDEAGFGNVTVAQLPHDIQNDYYVARKA